MGFENYSIGRTGDLTFCLKTEEGIVSKFHVGDSSLKAETAFNLTEKASSLYVNKLNKHPDKEFKTIRFMHAGRKWKIVEKEKEIWHSYILKFLNIIFFHKPAVLEHKEFTIESAWYVGSKCSETQAKTSSAFEKILPDCTNRHNYLDLRQAISKTVTYGEISPIEYKKGVRGKISLLHEPFSYSEHYADPYTRLATLAFERFEPQWKTQDQAKLFDCRYRFILKDNQLLLIDKRSPLATRRAKKAAGEAYKAHLIKQYGQDKIDYIKHLIGMKRDTFAELTPEHIFRINCSTTNLEAQEVKSGINALIQLNAHTDPSPLFLDFASNHIPGYLACGVNRALIQFSSASHPTFQHFKEWMSVQSFSTRPVESVSNTVLQRWLKIFLPTEAELDNAFTGKKILSEINGVYSCGEYEKFKPWLDQQELTQTFKSLVDSSSFESYLEKLTHIVVKKHLVRRHPTEGLRVGALIPAPPKEVGGLSRWYSVTSFSTNEYNYSYTLESLNNDPSLPAIKLCRNTSPSSYAAYSSKSIINDLNLLNSPGYMELPNLDHPDEDFFNQRTIPLWVGYKELAMRKMQEKASNIEVIALLEKANDALLKSEQEKHRPLSFREILKKHDVILNELYLRNERIYNFDGKTHSPEFLDLFKKLVRNYIDVEISQYNRIQETGIQSDKNAFESILKKMVLKESGKRESQLISDLIDDLEGKDLEKKAQELSDFTENTYKVLMQFQSGHKSLCEWGDYLEKIAKDRQEDIASKQNQSTVVAGQSLGGALSQVLVTRHFTNKERIPIPGHSCTLAEFDAPAINAEDNQRFLAFGNDNKELLNALDIKFRIFRRQEVGDIAPVAGEEHLGAVFTSKDADALEKDDNWLIFDAALNKRSKKTQRTEIAFAETVHDTRFLEGKNVARGFIALENGSAKRNLTRVKGENYDYVELKFNPYIQGIFDSHGKKGDLADSIGRSVYNDLYHKVWKFPRFQVLTESFRKSTDYIACCIRRLLLSKRQEDRTLKTKDLMGRVTVHQF